MPVNPIRNAGSIVMVRACQPTGATAVEPPAAATPTPGTVAAIAVVVLVHG